MKTKIMNYDPNLTNSGNMAVQIVKLTFGTWCYRAEFEARVGGNCNGLSVIETAVDTIYDTLKYEEFRGKRYALITMKDAEGNEMESQDDDHKGVDWLQDMLIAAEITSITPTKL